MTWKKSEFPIALRGEEFSTLAEACSAYGISPRFVSQFYKTSDTLRDALVNALRYKDIQSVYGMTLYAYTKAVDMLKNANGELDRKARVIKVQRETKFEDLNLMNHEVVKSKFVIFITKRNKYVENRKRKIYN